jgi:hypothetical protein
MTDLVPEHVNQSRIIALELMTRTLFTMLLSQAPDPRAYSDQVRSALFEALERAQRLHGEGEDAIWTHAVETLKHHFDQIEAQAREQEQ